MSYRNMKAIVLCAAMFNIMITLLAGSINAANYYYLDFKLGTVIGVIGMTGVMNFILCMLVRGGLVDKEDEEKEKNKRAASLFEKATLQPIHTCSGKCNKEIDVIDPNREV